MRDNCDGCGKDTKCYQIKDTTVHLCLECLKKIVDKQIKEDEK